MKAKPNDGLPKIEKGIPLPTKRTGAVDGLYAQLAKMEVGDSILIPNLTQSQVTGAASRVKPLKFTTRKMEDGIRIWRIE